MILSFLIAAFVISLSIAGRFPKVDRIFALLITITLIIMCATFENGADYSNYLDKISWVRNSRINNVDLMTQLTIASDPLFWSVTVLTEMINDDPLWVFIILLCIALLPKFWFTARFPAYRSLIISSYALFLGPTLEFAAIRAAAALGVLLLVLSCKKYEKKILGCIMAVTAHISAAVPVLVILLKRAIYRLPASIIAVGVILLIQVLSSFVSGLGRAQIYIDNKGTLFALGPPTVTIALIFVVFSGRWMRLQFRSLATMRESYQIALVCTSVALGGSLLWVTVAHRFLELGQFFFCVTACIALKAGCNWKRVAFGFIGLVVLLIYKNMTLGVWAIMI